MMKSIMNNQRQPAKPLKPSIFVCMADCIKELNIEPNNPELVKMALLLVNSEDLIFPVIGSIVS